MNGERHDEDDATSILRADSLDDEVLFKVEARPLGPSDQRGSAVQPIREPRGLSEFIRSHRASPRPRLIGPALVAKADAPLEEALAATVYPLGVMPGAPAPRGRRLLNEVIRFCIGRTSPNDIVIDDMSTSKCHAAIVRLLGDRWVVVDEGSTNGTFVDGRRLVPYKEHALGAVATLRFGQMRFVFFHPEAFSDYLASRQAERDRRDVHTPYERDQHRRLYDSTSGTWGGGTHQALSARIIARLRASAAAGPYFVTPVDGDKAIELATLSEVVAFIERQPLRISRIVACTDGGSTLTVYLKE